MHLHGLNAEDLSAASYFFYQVLTFIIIRFFFLLRDLVLWYQNLFIEFLVKAVDVTIYYDCVKGQEARFPIFFKA